MHFFGGKPVLYYNKNDSHTIRPIGEFSVQFVAPGARRWYGGSDRIRIGRHLVTAKSKRIVFGLVLAAFAIAMYLAIIVDVGTS